MPDIFECKKCKKALSDIYFDADGGFLCENCGSEKKVSKAALSALSYIFSADIKNLYSFKAPEEIVVELEEISCILYLIYVDEKVKSEEFLRELLGIRSKT
ncbi:hypothetical protein SDC9_197638 [bioreactor metagenome]|uniref:Uncharacterized protein n=1 Tax=bioreactor metagenome TaxID=1076179 RepID=A0A645IS31_9ZZZZ